MKTKLAISVALFAVALIAAWNVAPAAAAAFLFAFFITCSIVTASFALRSNDPAIREALDGRKGGDK